MQVELINYTPMALETLIFTKGTRLQGEWTFDDVCDKDYDWKMDQLEYMRKTIQSSFEFVDFTFRLSGVSRSFTHQLVRTRHGSYAQESMRAVDVRNAEVYNPSDEPLFEEAANRVRDVYAQMIDEGVQIQEAREILPTGITTSIIAKFNLRTLSQMAELRLCKRTAGEYQNVFKQMVKRVTDVYPWAEPFLKVYCVKTGLCAFPNYEECPVQVLTYKIPDEHKIIIQEAWEEIEHVANPVAKNGSTM